MRPKTRLKNSLPLVPGMYDLFCSPSFPLSLSSLYPLLHALLINPGHGGVGGGGGGSLPAHRPVVCVVGLVVHDKLVVDKVKAVGPRLERVLDHELPGGLVERGKLVDVLA